MEKKSWISLFNPAILWKKFKSYCAPEGKVSSKNLSHLFFGTLFCLFLFIPLVYFLFFYTPRSQSIAENRPLALFKAPSVSSLSDGSFMRDFEKALSDQMPLRTPMVSGWRTFSRGLSGLASYTLPETAEGKILSFLPGDIVLFESKNGPTLLQEPFAYEQKKAEEIKKQAELFSTLQKKLPKTRLFLMDIEPVFISPASPLNALYPNAVNGRYSDILHEYLPKEVMDLSFRTNTFDEVEQYYYRTDHHLKGEGAAKVYDMLYPVLSKGVRNFGKPLDLSRIEEISGTEMRGSKSRSASYPDLSEFLTAPVTELPDFEITLDGAAYPRSHIDQVLSGEYLERMKAEAAALGESVSPYLPCYAEVFGYDYGEVIYHNPSAKNNRTLLLVGPSYTQTFEQFLAAHYDTVYVIDPRSYRDFAGVDFSVIDYAKEKKVSDILYIVQPQYFADFVWQIR